MSIAAAIAARSLYYTPQAIANMGLDDEGDGTEVESPRRTEYVADDDTTVGDGFNGVGNIIDVRG